MRGSRSLNILMTADAVGGVWQYATDLAEALSAAGHSITLALLGPEPSADQRQRVREIAGLTMIETGLPLDWLCDGPAPVKAAAERLAALARDSGADVIHCNMPTLAGAAGFPVPIVAVTHGCLATWWQAARNEPLAPAYRWHRTMMRQGLAAADVVVAPSASYAAAIKRTYRLRALPQVVHNGRDHAATAASKQEPARAALTVGRLWDPAKNARVLDRTAAALHVPLLAAGAQTGPHGETIELSHLHLLGELDRAELSQLLGTRPVLVSAATFEPFGLAVLEAASAGCALVLSDIPTFRELWRDAAIFVDPDDAAAFAAAVNGLMADIPRRAQLAAAAAQRAARFTPAATAAAMMAVYFELLDQRRKDAA